eukprot:278914-Lingulodinium_polyedra.AAC.1
MSESVLTSFDIVLDYARRYGIADSAFSDRASSSWCECNNAIEVMSSPDALNATLVVAVGNIASTRCTITWAHLEAIGSVKD